MSVYQVVHVRGQSRTKLHASEITRLSVTVQLLQKHTVTCDMSQAMTHDEIKLPSEGTGKKERKKRLK